jgi:hypothetical protein
MRGIPQRGALRIGWTFRIRSNVQYEDLGCSQAPGITSLVTHQVGSSILPRASLEKSAVLLTKVTLKLAAPDSSGDQHLGDWSESLGVAETFHVLSPRAPSLACALFCPQVSLPSHSAPTRIHAPLSCVPLHVPTYPFPRA